MPQHRRLRLIDPCDHAARPVGIVNYFCEGVPDFFESWFGIRQKIKTRIRVVDPGGKRVVHLMGDGSGQFTQGSVDNSWTDALALGTNKIEIMNGAGYEK